MSHGDRFEYFFFQTTSTSKWLCVWCELHAHEFYEFWHRQKQRDEFIFIYGCIFRSPLLLLTYGKIALYLCAPTLHYTHTYTHLRFCAIHYVRGCSIFNSLATKTKIWIFAISVISVSLLVNRQFFYFKWFFFYFKQRQHRSGFLIVSNESITNGKSNRKKQPEIHRAFVCEWIESKTEDWWNKKKRKLLINIKHIVFFSWLIV